MKKFIAIALIALLALTTVFALDNGKRDEVVVKAKVGPISIQDALDKALKDGDPDVLYSLYGGMSASEIDEKEVDTQIDLNEEAVIVYFRIHQNYKLRTDEAVELKVTAGQLVLDGNSANASEPTKHSVDPTFSSIEAKSIENELKVGFTDPTTNELTFDLEYLDKTVTIEPRDIATFKATWAKQEQANKLVDGNYIATVVLQLSTK